MCMLILVPRAILFNNFTSPKKYIMINFQETIFDLAYKGAVEDVKSKISENPSLIFSKDGNERLLIHWASLAGSDQLVNYLIKHGSPVDSPDDIGMTPIILAASANRFLVVKLLIEAGANVNAQSIEGHSALQYSASKGWKQILELLIQQGAEINITDKRKATPLHRASSRGDVSIVSLMFKLAGENLKVNPVDAYGNTPLHLACEENNLQMAELLIQKGGDLELRNKEEKTPLDLASPETRRFLAKLRNPE